MTRPRVVAARLGGAARLAASLLCALVASGTAAQERDRFNLRVGLSGLYVTEQQNEPMPGFNEAATQSLGYADLRLGLDARRLPGQLEVHLDTRLRLTGDFSTAKASLGQGQVTARGYLGGREYELREATLVRRGERVDFGLGRQYVAEADQLKLDGARLAIHVKKSWDLGVFAGGYPNPFSRSLTTDYQGQGGYYGAQVAGGASVSYAYRRFWGSLAAVGSYLGGRTDPGPVNPAAPTQSNATTELTRSFLVLQGFERPTEWLDLSHSLVLDVAGAAGVQLTRLGLFATVRPVRPLTLRLAYDHLSSLAIEMYLTSLLATREDFALAPTLTNNLLVQRTARDQGRLDVDVALGKLHVFADGRVRYRSLVNGADDPQFVDPMTRAPLAPRLSGETTLGLRDDGSLAGLRGGLAYTYLAEARSASHLLTLGLGRSFLDERLSLDLAFLYAKTRDQGAGGREQCSAAIDTTVAALVLVPACFGTRDGASYETGLTVSARPFRRWFGLADYRVVINQTDGRPLLLTHVLLARIEARY